MSQPTPAQHIADAASAASAAYVANNGMFSTGRYAAAVGLDENDPRVAEMLDSHVQAGDIRPLDPDCFVSVVHHSDPDKPAPDRMLGAIKRRPDAVIAYHSALEVHGSAYAHGFGVDAFSLGPPETFNDGKYEFCFMEPAPGLNLAGGATPDGVETVVRFGFDVRVTTIERTVVDLFARPRKGGDILLDSLFLVDGFDPAAIARHARAVGDAAAAGALGFWLESERERYGVDDATLGALRQLAPRRLQYAMGARPGLDRERREALLGAGWNVLLPAQMVDPLFEGWEQDMMM